MTTGSKLVFITLLCFGATQASASRSNLNAFSDRDQWKLKGSLSQDPLSPPLLHTWDPNGVPVTIQVAISGRLALSAMAWKRYPIEAVVRKIFPVASRRYSGELTELELLAR